MLGTSCVQWCETAPGFQAWAAGAALSKHQLLTGRAVSAPCEQLPLVRTPPPVNNCPPPHVQAEVEALVTMCTADNVEELLSGDPDYVLDAIDNIDTKVRRHQQSLRS